MTNTLFQIFGVLLGFLMWLQRKEKFKLTIQTCCVSWLALWSCGSPSRSDSLPLVMSYGAQFTNSQPTNPEATCRWHISECSSLESTGAADNSTKQSQELSSLNAQLQKAKINVSHCIDSELQKRLANSYMYVVTTCWTICQLQSI